MLIYFFIDSFRIISPNPISSTIVLKMLTSSCISFLFFPTQHSFINSTTGNSNKHSEIIPLRYCPRVFLYSARYNYAT